MRAMRFLFEVSGIWVVTVLMKRFGSRRVWSLLSSSPWSELGGRDSSSAGVLIFPGMCLMTKLYSLLRHYRVVPVNMGLEALVRSSG